MTEHLPECPVIALLIKGNTVAAGSCICSKLRACEERVLDAAEAAIADIAGQDYDESYMALRAAVAAVRALKEKP